MGKVTKRARKFNAKGGVKAALTKGTVAKKGKLRKRTKNSGNGQAASARSTQDPVGEQRSDDFSGKDNLGHLDVENFFAMAAAELNEHQDKASDSEDNAEQPDTLSVSTSSGSDDDDDIDDAENRMKSEMAKIKDTDPEFHKFLKENEETLLDFSAPDQGIENDDDDDDDSDQRQTEKSEKQGIHLDAKVLNSLYQGAFQSHGIKGLKKIVSAYHTACHLGDTAQAADANMAGGPNRYIIESSNIFDQLMLTCLRRCHDEFRHHLLHETEDTEDNEKPIQPHKLEKSDKWSDLRPIIVSFFRSTLHIMEEAKEPQLLTLVLKSLSKYLPFLSAFGRIGDKMLKILTSLWSAPLDSSEDYHVVRLNAFFRIRQLALTQPFPFIETCLKKTYLAYARRARFGNSASVLTAMPTITFMGNCLVELYCLDYQSSYQHAFVYIRQLALLLRGALQKKTQESFQQVFCWQYVHCLKLWTAVLSEACRKEEASQMQTLVFPLTEVILGACHLSPSPVRFFPFRLHCVRLLQQLAAASESFIPTTALLLECLDWKEWYSSPKKIHRGTGILQPANLMYLVKFTKEDALRTKEHLEPAMTDFFLLLQREIELYRFSPGLPEFCTRIVQRLKVFSKETRASRWRTYAQNCNETCNKYSKVVIQERAKLTAAPKDVTGLEFLRPPSAPSMFERHQNSIEMESKALRNRQENPALGRQPKKAKPGSKQAGKPLNQQKKEKSSKTQSSKLLEDATIGQDTLQQADEVNEGVEWSDDEM